MRPDREMAAWRPVDPPARRIARTLAEFFAFAALMLMIVAWLVVTP